MIEHNASLHWSYGNFAGLPYALQLTIEQSSARDTTDRLACRPRLPTRPTGRSMKWRDSGGHA